MGPPPSRHRISGDFSRPGYPLTWTWDFKVPMYGRLR
jgi:hypothetical protein